MIDAIKSRLGVDEDQVRFALGLPVPVKVPLSFDFPV